MYSVHTKLDSQLRFRVPLSGFRSRTEPEPCRYIIARVNESIYFFITLGTLLKCLFTNLLYYELQEPRSREPSQNRRLRNPSLYHMQVLNVFFQTLDLFAESYNHKCFTQCSQQNYILIFEFDFFANMRLIKEQIIRNIQVFQHLIF